MKFLKKIVCLCFCILLFTGCGKDNSDSVVKDLTKKIEGIDSYHLSGVLEIINNENSYLYDVDVAFLKENNFRVSLKNQTNNHEQIILRNDEGVYVLTPSLNKSFKFQSEWPYNNSQSYLLHNLLNDIKNDNEYGFEVVDNGFVITTKTNYSNNKDLISQKIYLDKDKNISLVEVLDSNGLVKLKFTINDIDYNSNYDFDYFKLDNNMSVGSIIDDDISHLNDIVYPMYIPQNTFLSSQDKVSVSSGERVIMTFSGDYPFMLIQETVNPTDDSILSVSGEPLQLCDTVGVIDESSITWINDDTLYYLVSNSLDQNQLIEVANSLTVASIQK